MPPDPASTMLMSVQSPNKVLLMDASVGHMWQSVVSLTNVASAVEHAGQERALGAIFFTMQGFSTLALQDFVIHWVMCNSLLAEAEEFSDIAKNFRAREDFNSTLQTISKFRELVENNVTVSEWHFDQSDVAGWWLGNMTTFVDMLHTLQDEMATDVRIRTSSWSVRLRTTSVLSSVLLCFEFLFYPLFVFLTVRLLRSINDHSRELSKNLKILIQEQRRYAAFISEMYPASVAARLMKGQEVAPEIFETASVCFVEVADFDDLVRRIPGAIIVHFINDLFELIDAEASKHDVFKVETVGDQYVAVSGLPNRNGERHVTEIANLALGLLEKTRNLNMEHLPNRKIKLQIGISSGS
ncbi:receptor-type guanylate cyclase gcy-4 [Elysia marginata]|uniref:Receptor-type guanylate cyclase gcy-4 n=1 Tax=Elysia marginata TaxID=1093978 RepID=A0AAV4HFG5_9GAST|nr:receptor-type guanylate cyclase gcy-4 [Elysia marginata]